MNPYDFVRTDWQQPGARRTGPKQDRFEGISGRLQGTLTTLTPLLIAGERCRVDDLQTFKLDHHKRYIIPGTSIKGLIRNLVETVDGGAWWFFGANGQWRNRDAQGDTVNYRDNLPDGFRRPAHVDQLDAACRMFGFLDQRQVLAGNVGFEDAICEVPVPHRCIYTCILSSPKPRHRAWYLDDQQQWVRGRKFYFHATRLQTVSGWLPHHDVPSSKRQNAYIHPVGSGSVFTFKAHFTNVAPVDFALLLYALVLEPKMRHKMGYAKPAGLGSVEMAIEWLETVDYLDRYRKRGSGIKRYEDEALTAFIKPYIARFTSDQTATTLQDLRRIWQWPPIHDIHYPDRNWFTRNPTAPLNATP